MVWGQAFLVAAFGLCTFFCFTHYSKNLSELRMLANSGRQATGMVTRKNEMHGKSTTYEVYYSFHAGSEITDEQDVDLHEYVNYDEDGPISVTYLPNDPAVHRVGTVDSARVVQGEATLRLATTLWTVGGILIIGLVWAGYLKEKRMLASASVTTGTVIGSVRLRGRGASYKVTYEFEAGGVRYSRLTTLDALRGRAAPVGTQVTVYYWPSDPKRSKMAQQFTMAELC